MAASGELFDSEFKAAEVIDQVATDGVFAGVNASPGIAVEAAFAEVSGLANAL